MTRKGAKQGLARFWPRFLLVIPFLLAAYVPFFNRIEPTFRGIPFFYWYQLAAIIAGAVVVATVYLLEMRIVRGRADTNGDLDASGTPGDIL